VVVDSGEYSAMRDILIRQRLAHHIRRANGHFMSKLYLFRADVRPPKPVPSIPNLMFD